MTDLNVLSQIGIAVFGCSAAFFVGSAEFHVRRWAYVLGLIGQPCWWYTTYANRQWGIFVLCMWYTFTWARGFYIHWIRKPPTSPDVQSA